MISVMMAIDEQHHHLFTILSENGVEVVVVPQRNGFYVKRGELSAIPGLAPVYDRNGTLGAIIVPLINGEHSATPPTLPAISLIKATPAQPNEKEPTTSRHEVVTHALSLSGLSGYKRVFKTVGFEVRNSCFLKIFAALKFSLKRDGGFQGGSNSPAYYSNAALVLCSPQYYASALDALSEKNIREWATILTARGPSCLELTVQGTTLKSTTSKTQISSVSPAAPRMGSMEMHQFITKDGAQMTIRVVLEEQSTCTGREIIEQNLDYVTGLTELEIPEGRIVMRDNRHLSL